MALALTLSPLVRAIVTRGKLAGAGIEVFEGTVVGGLLLAGALGTGPASAGVGTAILSVAAYGVFSFTDIAAFKDVNDSHC